LSRSDRERIALELHAFRVDFCRSDAGYLTLSAVRSDERDNEWYRRAVGKGVWVLHELRNRLGTMIFDNAMDSFGRTHAGKRVTTNEFRKPMEQAAKKDLKPFFDYWVHGQQLPAIGFKEPFAVEERDGKFEVVGLIAGDPKDCGNVCVAVQMKGRRQEKSV